MSVDWLLFLIASVAVIVAPGQDMVLVMTRSIAQGSLAGVATAAGVSCGLLLHTLLATVGIGAIIQASAALFFLMKLLGAAYLIYLGFSLLSADALKIVGAGRVLRPIGKLFLDGLISNVANPKITIFYFAFLPQFILADASSPALSIFSAGVAFALMTFLIKGPVGFMAGKLSAWFMGSPVYLKAIYRISGLTLIGLAVNLVIEER